MKLLRLFVTAAVLALVAAPAVAQRQMEFLDRGVVAVNQGGGKVWVGWRLLGTDPQDLAFNVYRQSGQAAPVKLNEQPLTGPTHFIDTAPALAQPTAYTVAPIVNGREQQRGKPFVLPANAPERQYLSVPLKTPQGYAPNDASVGDLDGDGEYEIVLHQTGRGRDNSQDGETDPPVFQAYKLDGTLMWTINLGKNVREGAHYSQFMVYDLDGDGRSEVVCKTADGSTDAAGTVIGDSKANYVRPNGRILDGPEFLTVFDGPTGKALATTKYIPARDEFGPDMRQVWGDDRGNRGDRFLAAVAYLDGVRPSVVMCRGYYTRSVLVAYDWRDGKLTHRWTFDSGAQEDPRQWAGQGNHNLSVTDVDNDGRDEIVYGAMVVDDNGKGLYSTRLGHGDAMHVGDLDPTRPGLEMFRIQERFDDAGGHMVALDTGEVLWRKPSRRAATSGGDRGEGPGRGVAFDIDPRHPGSESWTAGAGITGVWDAKGNEIGQTKPPSCNFAAWWDGDELRELLDGNHVDKWNWNTEKAERLLTAEGAKSINGTKSNPSLSADLLGDWREEIIFPSNDGTELRIYTTTIPTERRLYTLMHNPQYRLSIAWQNVAYNQPPHVDYYLGAGMKDPPRPNIQVVQPRSTTTRR